MEKLAVALPRNEGNVQYWDYVDRLFKREGFNPLAHAVMGISGEAGELLDAIKKHVIYGKPLDRDNVVEEIGDLMFYVTALMNELVIMEEEVVLKNVEKLNKRYSEGYSDAAAIARADKVPQFAVAGSLEDFNLGRFLFGPTDSISATSFADGYRSEYTPCYVGVLNV